MKSGELMVAGYCGLWSTRAGSPVAGRLVGHLDGGDLVVVLQVHGIDALVMSTKGIVGWIDGVNGRSLRPVP